MLLLAFASPIRCSGLAGTCLYLTALETTSPLVQCISTSENQSVPCFEARTILNLTIKLRSAT